MSNLWNNDNPVADLGIDVPAWIEQDITPADVAAIIHSGCASGAYMPAVAYHQAEETMGEHGNDVLEFIEQQCGELPEIPRGESWTGIAVFFLSCAVELWAQSVKGEIEAVLLEEEKTETADEYARRKPETLVGGAWSRRSRGD